MIDTAPIREAGGSSKNTRRRIFKTELSTVDSSTPNKKLGNSYLFGEPEIWINPEIEEI